MPPRAPSPTARATAPTPGSPVSTEDAVWNDTATTPVTVTSRLLMGRIAIMVSAAGWGGGHGALGIWEVRGNASQPLGKLELLVEF